MRGQRTIYATMGANSFSPEKALNFAIIGGIAYFAYRLYLKFSENPLDLSSSDYSSLSKEEKKALNNNAVTEVGSSATLLDKARAKLAALKINGKSIQVNSSHTATANSFEKAMKGAQTDEAKIIPVIKSMNQVTLLCVFIAYGVRRTRLSYDLWGGTYTTGNLIDHLQDDLSEKEFEEIRPYFRKAGLL